MKVSIVADRIERRAMPGPGWLGLSLRVRLFAVAALMLTVTVLLAVLLQSSLANRTQTRRVLSNELPMELQVVANSLQTRLNRTITIAETFSNNSFIRSWVKAGCPGKDLPAIEQALAQAQSDLKAETAFLAANLSDHVLYLKYANNKLEKELIAENKPVADWYYNFVRAPYDFELNLDTVALTRNELLMYVNYRSEAKTASGEFPLVVVGGGIPVQELADLIRASKIGNSGSIMLAREDGMVDVHLNMAHSGRLNLHDQPGFASLLADDWRMVREKKIAVIETATPLGNTIYVAAMYLPNLRRYLVGILPATDITQSTSRNQWLTLAVAAALLVLAVALLYPLTGRLLHPLEHLRLQIANLTDTLKLNTRLHTRDRAEIGQICGQLNQFLERLHTAEERIKYMAFHDNLTKLPNRVMFRDALARHVHQKGEQNAVALLYIDLDGFKKINDTMGHAAGDQLLEQVARRLEGCVRRQDVVARLGGDEFAMLLAPPTSTDVAREVAGRIVEVLGQPFTLDGQQARIGGSVGVALSADSIEASELIKHADLALYAAKEGGRKQYRFFDPALESA